MTATYDVSTLTGNIHSFPVFKLNIEDLAKLKVLACDINGDVFCDYLNFQDTNGDGMYKDTSGTNLFFSAEDIKNADDGIMYKVYYDDELIVVYTTVLTA